MSSIDWPGLPTEVAAHAQNMNLETELRRIASAVRAIIEEYASAHDHDIMFQSFPRGTCGPVSELLGRYLVEVARLDAGYVCAEWLGDGSHAWIEVDGIIVDITADQFGQAPVIVTRHSPWHQTWTREAPRPPICSRAQWPAYPQAAWAAIVKGMVAVSPRPAHPATP
jgi:hypothetical protein